MKSLPARVLWISCPHKHLVVGFVQLLEFLFISSHVGMIEFCEPLISGLDLRDVALRDQVLSLELEYLQADLFMLGKPGSGLLLGLNAARIDALVIVFREHMDGGGSLGVVVPHKVVPFLTRLENKIFQVFCRFFPGGPRAHEPGDFTGPDGQHIHNHIFPGEREGCISDIEGSEQAFGKPEDPVHLVAAFR